MSSSSSPTNIWSVVFYHELYYLGHAMLFAVKYLMKI